jgi:hypothetical protein
MAGSNPSWSDSFKYDGGSFGGGGDVSSYWQPDPGAFNDFDSGSWSKGFGLKGNDPFGLDKDKDKKESPWGDVLRFAGNKLSEYAQSKGGQGIGFAGGGGGVSQNGELTIVYPQAPTVIPGQKGGLGSTIGSIAGAALGTLVAPGIGTTIGGQLGGAAGSMF